MKSRPRLPIPDEDPYYIPGTVMTRITDSSDSGYGGVTGNSNRGVMNAIDGNCDQESHFVVHSFINILCRFNRTSYCTS